MSVTGLVNLGALASTQSIVQSHDPPDGAQNGRTQPDYKVNLPEDTFTPSAKDEFTSAQLTISSAPAPNVAPPTEGHLRTEQPALQVSTISEPVTRSLLEQSPKLARGATSAAAVKAPVNAQGQQLQSLNAHLVGLGLSYNDIKYIDRIASLIKAFNPALYTDLVQQFQARAELQTAIAAGGTPATLDSTGTDE